MDKKRRLWPWIVGTLVMLPVLYVLSFGPACWLTARPRTPSGVRGGDYGPRAMIFYWPLSNLLVQEGTPVVSPVLEWWIGVGVGTGSVVVLPTDPIPEGGVQIYF